VTLSLGECPLICDVLSLGECPLICDALSLGECPLICDALSLGECFQSFPLFLDCFTLKMKKI
jgi:hypothetical protein